MSENIFHLAKLSISQLKMVGLLENARACVFIGLGVPCFRPSSFFLSGAEIKN